MKIVLLLLLACLPAYILGKYIYSKDNNKEPKKLLKKIVIFGVLSSIPAIIGEMIFSHFFPEPDGLYGYLFKYFIGVALIEEFCKFLPGYVIGIKGKEFDEVYDSIVYMAFSALGFALIENIFYVLENGVVNGILRAILSVPGHIGYGVIMGYFLGIAYKNLKNGDKIHYFLNILYGFFIAVICHGLYDFSISYGIAKMDLILTLFAFLLCLFVFVFSLTKIIKVTKNKETFDDKNFDNKIGPKLIVGLLCLVVVGCLPKPGLTSFLGIKSVGDTISIDDNSTVRVSKVKKEKINDKKYIVVSIDTDSSNLDFSKAYLLNYESDKVQQLESDKTLSIYSGKTLLYYEVSELDCNKYMLAYDSDDSNEIVVFLGNDFVSFFK